jgi:hypothetical protein
MQQRRSSRRTLLGDVPTFFVGAGRGALVSRRARARTSTLGVRASAVVLLCIGAALVLGALARSAVGPAPSFRISGGFYMGTLCDPPAFAIGDLNGDGRPDIASACTFDASGEGPSEEVALFFNVGNGRFVYGGALLEGEEEISSVAIGDLNRDGAADVAAMIMSTGTLAVILNRGGGTFSEPVEYPWYSDVVEISDLNRDGSADLVTTHSNSVSVLRNRGDGSFARPVDYGVGRSGRGGGWRPVATADLNGDGAPDLITPNDKDTTVSVLLNRGDGTFLSRRDYVTGPHPGSLAVGDLNGDRRMDVATTVQLSNEVGGVSVLLDKGDGTLRRGRIKRVGSNSSVAIGDLNQDGAADLAVVSELGVSVLPNRGAGNFGGRLDYGTGGWSGDSAAAAIADFDGDGRLDLAVANVKYRRNAINSDLAVLLNMPGLCNVQWVRGLSLTAAKRKLVRVNCRIGKVSSAYSKVKTGRVISTKPGFTAVLRGGTKVSLVVSKGRRR